MSTGSRCNSCSIHCPAEFQPPGSPCPALLTTNSVPSDAQIREIHNFIGSLEAGISLINDQIAQAQRTLDRLGAQRAKLRDVIKSHRCVASTIRRLPRDILGEVFSQYLGAVDSHPHSPNALLHLVGVCEHWRTTALTSPLLWRHVNLHIKKSTYHDSREMEQNSLQLQRSAPVALSIRLEARQELHSFRVGVVDSLLTESRRWQELFLFVHPSYYTHLSMFKFDFPILVKLTLVIWKPLSNDTALFFKSLPALADLTLQTRGTHKPSTQIPTALDFIWVQLRTCTLIGCWAVDVLRILPLFSAGTRVCIDDCFGLKEVHLTSVHTAVSDLSLCCYEEKVAVTLLGALTAPCLRKFYFTGHFSILPITAFFDRSSCALTHLGIRRGHNPNGFQVALDLLTLLASPHACDIVDLEVELNPMPKQFADALVAGTIFPDLRVLALRNCHWLEGGPGAVASVLEMYVNRQPVFQSLWLSRPRLPFSQDVIQALKSSGLEVVTFSEEDN